MQNRNKMGALRQEVETLRKQNQEYQVRPCAHPHTYVYSYPHLRSHNLCCHQAVTAASIDRPKAACIHFSPMH